MKKTKVILFTSPGLNGNLVYSFLNKNHQVVGVVFDSPGSAKKLLKKRIKKLGILKVLLQLVFMKGLVPLLRLESRKRTKEILAPYQLNELDSYQNIFKPNSINDSKVVSFVNNLNADVVIVSGTRLIQNHIIEGIKAPLLNMHVGITPKYRGVHGGYWALVNKDIENCGVTVHHIDSGIDTGGIISQKNIQPTKRDNYTTYPILQILKGLDCIEDAIQEIKNNNLTVKNNNLKSKLYYHPSIIDYVYNRIFNKVK